MLDMFTSPHLDNVIVFIYFLCRETENMSAQWCPYFFCLRSVEVDCENPSKE